MNEYNIAVIPGDGIGVEVVESAIKILDATSKINNFKLNYKYYEWGSEYFIKNKMMMPENALNLLAESDSIFLGAIGHPDIQDHITLNGLLLPIRRKFDQYVCIRPSVLFPGVNSPLKNVEDGDIDIVVVRENTEGEYANVGGFQYQDSNDEIAIQSSIFTRKGTERIIRYAFELAMSRDKKLTSITKSNAQGYSMVLWDKVFEEVSKDFPEIETNSLLIDAACMDFIRKPKEFDVVVASNLFGDILTDIGAMITGGLGLASSGNISFNDDNPSMFEPTHGSAPDIAGKNLANPIAQILTGAMMLSHLGEDNAAYQIRESVIKTLKLGKNLTSDLGGNSKTDICTNDILNNL
ncbi:MAG: tartrate dehydrogenase [Chloroflexi bacterium]|nr:tartrate dehydrogenase [Chloroflexota bacterium]|tara:strand:- start:335 stop:1390 length:1056 start_codon:yes stop_codon:yes gene_type:complete